jgi:hypothetical protein
MQVSQGGAFTARSSRCVSSCTVGSTAAAAAVVPQMTLAAAGNPLVVLKGIVTGVKVSIPKYILLYGLSYFRSAPVFVASVHRRCLFYLEYQ